MTKRAWGRIIVYIGMPLLLVITLLLTYLYWNRSLSQELARTRCEGYPVTFAELNTYYPSPKGPNAADAYMRAFGLLQNSRENSLILENIEHLSVGDTFPDGMKARTAKYLEENASALVTLHEAAAVKECRYPVDFRNGITVSLPTRFNRFRESAGLLEVSAIYSAQVGRHAESAEAVIAGLAIARSVENEPNLTSFLMVVSARQASLKAMSRAMSLIQFDDADLQSISCSLQDELDRSDVVHVIAGERCLYYNLWTYLWGNIWDRERTGPLVKMLYASTGTDQRDRMFYLRTMRRWAEIAALPLPTQLTVAQAYKAEVDKSTEPARTSRTQLWTPYLTSSVFLYPYDSVLALNALSIATLRCAKAAVGVEAFRLKHGSLPNNLAELVPDYLSAIPVDPFNGKPLLFKRLSKGYVVYSVGENATDDGGIYKAIPLPDRHKFDDYPFQVIR